MLELTSLIFINKILKYLTKQTTINIKCSFHYAPQQEVVREEFKIRNILPITVTYNWIHDTSQCEVII